MAQPVLEILINPKPINAYQFRKSIFLLIQFCLKIRFLANYNTFDTRPCTLVDHHFSNPLPRCSKTEDEGRSYLLSQSIRFCLLRNGILVRINNRKSGFTYLDSSDRCTLPSLSSSHCTGRLHTWVHCICGRGCDTRPHRTHCRRTKVAKDPKSRVLQ